MVRKGQNSKEKLSFPCIIKPARLGSSIGISIVKDEKDLEYAKDVGFEFDNDLVVEEFKTISKNTILQDV